MESSSGGYEKLTIEFTSSVESYNKVPCFGHGSDITILFPPNINEQADHAAGLIAFGQNCLSFGANHGSWQKWPLSSHMPQWHPNQSYQPHRHIMGDGGYNRFGHTTSISEVIS